MPPILRENIMQGIITMTTTSTTSTTMTYSNKYDDN